ncbi:SdpI family protein [Dietzia sp.]|uniref:SdpI family protein n=1 Tax=Dietzia sp. TaxID=1871616 RepID=UPI002FD91A39
MDAIALIPIVLLGLVDVGMVVLGYRAASGALRRNRLVGIRTRATLASDKAWAVGHSAGGPAMAFGGVLALVLLVLPLAVLGVDQVGVLVSVVLSCVALLVSCIVASVLGDQAARRVRDSSGRRAESH